MTVAQRSRAAKQIARNGQTVTIEAVQSAGYNPVGGVVSGSSYSKTVKAVLLPWPSPLKQYKLIDGLDIKQGDELLLIAGLDINGDPLPQPPVNSVVTLADGVTKKTLIVISRVAPAGLDIIYDSVVRGNA